MICNSRENYCSYADFSFYNLPPYITAKLVTIITNICPRETLCAARKVKGQGQICQMSFDLQKPTKIHDRTKLRQNLAVFEVVGNFLSK